MSRADGIDELDPRFPIEPGWQPPLFRQVLCGFWPHSSAFAMAEWRRAGKHTGRRRETSVRPRDDVPPAPYPELAEDTLAREFAGLGEGFLA